MLFHYCGIVLLSLIPVIHSTCMHFVCTETFQPYTPQLQPEECRWQFSKPVSHVQTYYKPHSCPKNVHCPGQYKVRFACNCREIDHCRWASWGPWGSAIPDGSCGDQRRTRQANARYKYRVEIGNCNGIVSSCPRKTDNEQRKRCRCKKADVCDLSPWSAWAGHVPNGQCADQRSTQAVTPRYTYVDQPDNCNMVRSTCDPARTRTKRACQCPSKICMKQQWTQWSQITAGGNNCPKEERTRSYTFTLQYIEAIDNCNNVGVKSCRPTEGEERQKDVKCPRLTAPINGRLLDQACNGISSSCGSVCSFQCSRDFKMVGKNSIKCKGDGTWDGSPPTCKDDVDPTIICPNKTSFPNDANKKYAEVTIPMANATDNVGIVSLVANVTNPVTINVGQEVTVKYIAKDAAGNSAKCDTIFMVEDNEPPKVISCPSDIERKVAQDGVSVTWIEPVFEDNVEGRAVDRIPTYYSGHTFPKGKWLVRYVAKDKAGNEAVCEFNIIISDLDNRCEVYNEPKNGSLACTNRVTGSSKDYVCGVSCKNGFGFAKASDVNKVYNFYICQSPGGWHGTNDFNQSRPSMPVRLPTGKRPWPDCARKHPADAVTKHFTIMAGPCNANKTKEQLRKEFKEKLKNDRIIQALFCTSSKCEIDNIKVSCPKSQKRSVGTLAIEFDMVMIPDLPPLPPVPAGRTFSNVDDLKRIEEMLKKKIEEEIKRLQRLLQMLQDKIKQILAQLLRINEQLVQIISGQPYVDCPKGSTMSRIGNPPKKVCTRCPLGKLLDEQTKACEDCPKGTYQDEEGKAYCKACRTGTTTLVTGVTNAAGCKAICRPGTYSRSNNGLATCLACTKGHYQPKHRQSACIACPNGKTTAGYGSTSVNDCK